MALLPVRGHVGALLPAKPCSFVESRQHCGKLFLMGQSSFFLTGFDYVTNGQARVVEELQNPKIRKREK